MGKPEEIEEIEKREAPPSDAFDERGAVVLKPEPPRRGTFALLIPEKTCWNVAYEAGSIRLDFRPMTRSEKGDFYRQRRQAQAKREKLAKSGNKEEHQAGAEQQAAEENHEQ